ncbi:hypothetical protein YC2023_119367 [Brassica napus]
MDRLWSCQKWKARRFTVDKRCFDSSVVVTRRSSCWVTGGANASTHLSRAVLGISTPRVLVQLVEHITPIFGTGCWFFKGILSSGFFDVLGPKLYPSFLVVECSGLRGGLLRVVELSHPTVVEITTMYSRLRWIRVRDHIVSVPGCC